jgi:hypothetical protein
MNYFGYNPLQAMGQGLGLYHGIEQSYDNQLARDQLARAQAIEEQQRNTLADIGQQPYLLGFEDNPAALRPEAVKQLWRVNPALALQAEQRVAEPFLYERQRSRDQELLDRDVARQNALAQAKADIAWRAVRTNLPSVFKQSAPGQGVPRDVSMTTGQGQMSGMGTVYSPESTGMGQVMPTVGQMPDPNAGYMGAALGNVGLGGYSDQSVSIDIGPDGLPRVTVKQPSELESETRRRKSIQEGRDVELKGQSLAEQMQENQRQAVNKAHERVIGIAQEITNVKSKQSDMIFNGQMTPQQAMEQIAPLQSLYQRAVADRDALILPTGSSRVSPPAELTPQAGGTAGTGKSQAPSVRSQASGPAPSSQLGAGLSPKLRGEVQAHVTKEQAKMSLDTIKAAEATANKVAIHDGAFNEMYQMLKTKEIGNRAGKIPGGETALRIISIDNDELQKWRDEIIDPIKEGISAQEINTLPELNIKADRLPNVTNSPATNKKAMAHTMNWRELALAAPGFLQKWKDNHGGSLDGAGTMAREWTANQKRYTADEKDGAVSLNEKPIIPLNDWMSLRKQFAVNDILTLQKKLPSADILPMVQQNKIRVKDGKVQIWKD